MDAHQPTLYIFFIVSLRLLWSVWWTTLMMRMKRKKMRRKSSLRGSGPAWVLKAKCPLFGRGGTDIESLPSSLLWSSHWSSACLCHLSVSLRRQTKDELPPHSVPPDLCSSFLPQWKEMGSFSFTGKKDRSVCSFSPLIFTSSPPKKLLSSSWRTHWPFTNFHNTLLLSLFWPPSEQLSPPHPPSYLPTREAAVEKMVPRRFPTLLCCYSNSSKEAAVLQPHRNPHMSLYELSLPSSSNPSQRAPEAEEARTQAASVWTVRRASQASRTSRHSL